MVKNGQNEVKNPKNDQNPQKSMKFIDFWKFWRFSSGNYNMKLAIFEFSRGTPRGFVKNDEFWSKMTIFWSFLGLFWTPKFLPPNQRFWGPKRSFLTLQPSHFRRQKRRKSSFWSFLVVFWYTKTLSGGWFITSSRPGNDQTLIIYKSIGLKGSKRPLGTAVFWGQFFPLEGRILGLPKGLYRYLMPIALRTTPSKQIFTRERTHFNPHTYTNTRPGQWASIGSLTNHFVLVSK